MLFLLPLVLFSCVGIKKVDTIRFVVRENPREVIDKVVNYELLDAGRNVWTSGQSNELGYFELNRTVLSDQLNIEPEEVFKMIRVKVTGEHDETELYLNDYIDFYDVYLYNDCSEVAEHEKIADMHYHISMRSHNKFAFQFHDRGAGEDRICSLLLAFCCPSR